MMAEFPDNWHPMESAPRDGTIFAVLYHEWNVSSNPPRVQLAQWVPGMAKEFHSPWNPDSHVYADGWVTLDELQAVGA